MTWTDEITGSKVDGPETIHWENRAKDLSTLVCRMMYWARHNSPERLKEKINELETKARHLLIEESPLRFDRKKPESEGE